MMSVTHEDFPCLTSISGTISGYSSCLEFVFHQFFFLNVVTRIESRCVIKAKYVLLVC